MVRAPGVVRTHRYTHKQGSARDGGLESSPACRLGEAPRPPHWGATPGPAGRRRPTPDLTDRSAEQAMSSRMCENMEIQGQTGRGYF